MQNSQLVSVIIPVFNCAKYVSEAISSALQQTYRALEILVVNDGSTDNSAEVLASWGEQIRVFSQPNAGISAARNLAIANARGDFFAFLDADDLWVPNKLEVQLTQLATDLDLGAVFGGVKNFVSPELPEEFKQRANCDSQVVPCQLPSTLLVRRPVFENVGPFSPELKRAEGIDWYARARDLGVKMLTLPDLMVHRRIYKTQEDSADRREMLGYVHALKRSLDRRRSQAPTSAGTN